MPDTENYDILVIGSGEAGKYIAWTMATAGRRTAVVERRYVGGSCPNIACLPSKNVIHSAKVASLAARRSEFGVESGPVEIDMKAVQLRKRKMVGDLIEFHRDRYADSGAELIMGEARFVAPGTVTVSLNDGDTRVIAGERVILNVGTRATVPDIPGLAEAKPLTHVEALDLERLPEHLIVLGGGYVGLELAQAFRRFGSRVTVVEMGPQLAGREDADIAAAILELFTDEGVDVLLDAEVRRVEGSSGSEIRVSVKDASGERVIEATDFLVAAGRIPNTQDIGLDLAGIELDERGYIEVNDRLETTAANVWAVGDCTGSQQFTHVAYDDFRIVRDNLNGGDRSTKDRLVPYVMFTDPELARVGLNETEAKSRAIDYRLARLPMKAVLRTRTISEPRGFIKMLIEAASDKILGIAVFGAEASEMMAVVQTAMMGGLPYTMLRDGIFTHPTMAEGLTLLLGDVAPKTTQGSAA
jgi:pyruvate/2-oxoglutarate dehydrogenase complex dihydrolipoamide dehydrogenase (E3) component